MSKKIIVACGGAVATSTIVAHKIEEFCKQNQVDVEICQVRLSEIRANLDGASLIIPTGKVNEDYGVPVISGMPFIAGVGVERVEAEILQLLKETE